MGSAFENVWCPFAVDIAFQKLPPKLDPSSTARIFTVLVFDPTAPDEASTFARTKSVALGSESAKITDSAMTLL